MYDIFLQAQKDKKVADDKDLSILEPNLSVQITSSQPLELTITTTALQVSDFFSIHFYFNAIYSPCTV